MTVIKNIPSELLDTLLSGYQKTENLIGENGLLKQLTKALVERGLEVEMIEHLGLVVQLDEKSKIEAG